MTTICATDYKTPKLVSMSNLKIRKLTPKECFRLMGVKDEDFDKVKKNQSDSSLYHLAGDSIVCQCLEAIFKEMIE
jgi:DNA (cytosine-5)-methyltransferase 1